MVRHEFDIYVELYKRKEYRQIPIGEYSKGEYFFCTEKQIRTLHLLSDETTVNVGYGGSARCFTGETLVQASTGHKPIADIVEGDLVLTFNETTKVKEYKKVLKKFAFSCAVPPKMAIFTNNLKCTYDHEFLFNGKWTRAFELAERNLDSNPRQLLHIEPRQISNAQPQGKREVEINEACERREWVLTDNVKNEWEDIYDKTAQDCSTSVYSESVKQTLRESHRLQSSKQYCSESRMVYSAGKRKAFTKSGAIKLIQKGRKTTRKLLKAWRGQRESDFNRSNGFGNTGQVHATKIHPKDVVKRIRSNGMYDKGCYPASFMESREITNNEISGIRFEYLNEIIYDLHVEDNHNYTVTTDNIIVHNSGKSVIECTAIIMDCFAYEGIAWGLARKELTVLKRTVLLTLFKQLGFYGLKKDKDYNYNQQLNKITFSNGSEIFLIDTASQPSDPLLTRFGGFELTRCAIDESNETDAAVVEKLFERTGWRLNDKYGLKRKLFECFNPAKNHVYFRFYIPFKENREKDHIKFVVALPSDNPHPSVKEWIDDMIKTSDEVTVQRQVYGNFDYDDDPAALCTYKNILNIFTNDHVQRGDRRISADLAMQGRDKFIAGYWDGGVCKVAVDKGKSSGKEIESDLYELKVIHNVANTNIIADSDGLGAYLESYIENIVTFHGGAKASDMEFFNLKSQCAFKLAEKINNNEIRIICNDTQKDAIIAEISVCLKRENLDADASKKKIMSKEEMKKRLGRSPDYLDMLIMGMWFFIFENDYEFVIHNN